MDEWRIIDEQNVKKFADAMTSEFLERREVGIKKYGTSFVGDPQTHQREEILDALFYNWAANQEREYLLNRIKKLEEVFMTYCYRFTKEDMEEIKEYLKEKENNAN